MTSDSFASLSADDGKADPAQSPCILQVAALRRWLSDLPMAHTLGAAQQLIDQLEALNRARVGSPRRLSLLRCLEPYAAQLLLRLREAYRDAAQPLPEASLRYFQVALHMDSSLIRAYRLIHATDQGLGRRARHAGGQIVHHAGLTLVECYLAHVDPPQGLWTLLHTHGLEAGYRKPVPAYGQALLTAACNPWGLSSSEVLGLYDQGGRWSRYLHFAPARTGKSARLAVDPNSDAGPFLITSMDPAPEQALALITTPLLTAMNSTLQRRAQLWRSTTPMTAEERQHAEQLYRLLSATAPRRFPRRHSTGEMTMITGLTRICRALSADTAAPKSATFESRAPRAGFPQDDVWKMIYPTQDLLAETQPTRNQGEEAAPRPSTAVDSRWRVTNRSAEGYLLMAETLAPGTTRVGELVLIRDRPKGLDASWELGVIRWLRHHPGENIQAGIQVISPCPRAVQIQAEVSDGRLTIPTGALLTPEVTQLGVPASLVTPALGYNTGKPIVLHSGGGRSAVMLGACIERTSGFARYIYRRKDVGDVD
ncbi:hypothetical protein [Aquisalimonas sp.]|uniref:hypothetical protein n=1 Tax=Aquisalimonas sp. TaxID=1872621 RepID=UPI0025B970E3|nr:hypothetical protein [Aquisalimonas sp.]